MRNRVKGGRGHSIQSVIGWRLSTVFWQDSYWEKKSWDFPSGSDGKECASSAGDLGSISGSRRSPGGRHGNLLQYPWLENPHGQQRLACCSPWGSKESDMTEWLSTQMRDGSWDWGASRDRVRMPTRAPSVTSYCLILVPKCDTWGTGPECSNACLWLSECGDRFDPGLFAS